jgi:hypothetical protein
MLGVNREMQRHQDKLIDLGAARAHNIEVGKVAVPPSEDDRPNDQSCDWIGKTLGDEAVLERPIH